MWERFHPTLELQRIRGKRADTIVIPMLAHDWLTRKGDMLVTWFRCSHFTSLSFSDSKILQCIVTRALESGLWWLKFQIISIVNFPGVQGLMIHLGWSASVTRKQTTVGRWCRGCWSLRTMGSTWVKLICSRQAGSRLLAVAALARSQCIGRSVPAHALLAVAALARSAKVSTPKCDTCFGLVNWGVVEKNKFMSWLTSARGIEWNRFCNFWRLFEYPTSFQSEGHRHTYSRH
jgi:hypothetical protein